MGVVNLPSGRPTMQLTGGAKRRLEAITPAGYEARIDLTITDEGPMAHGLRNHLSRGNHDRITRRRDRLASRRQEPRKTTMNYLSWIREMSHNDLKNIGNSRPPRACG